MSNTSKIINYKIENGYFSGGQVRLNSDYKNCTIIAVAKYNRSSKQRLFEAFAYYGGAISFEELVSNNQRFIGIAYAGGLIETNYIFFFFTPSFFFMIILIKLNIKFASVLIAQRIG